MKDRRQINLREYFSYLEMLIEKEKLNLYDVVEIEYLIARLIEYDIFLQRSILRGLLIFQRKSENAVIERRLFKLIKLIKDKINMYKESLILRYWAPIAGLSKISDSFRYLDCK